ncbi:MAG TPA: hypothetical protein PK472_02385 [Pseudomonadota bacterium]|nr:hypothetical protein [Pseudomonadota bacterium]
MQSNQLPLPGWRSTLRIAPLRHPVSLDTSIKLHGVLHTVANVGHDTSRTTGQKPHVILIPRAPIGSVFGSEEWEAHWTHEKAHSLSDRVFPVEIFGAIRRIEIGPFHEMAISIPTATVTKIKVSAVTPLLTKETGGGFRETLAPNDWRGSLHQAVRRWYGSQKWLDKAKFDMSSWARRHISVDTRWSGRPVSGWMWEWSGSANAEGLLALRVAEQLGIGSTVSRGYGRLHVDSIS